MFVIRRVFFSMVLFLGFSSANLSHSVPSVQCTQDTIDNVKVLAQISAAVVCADAQTRQRSALEAYLAAGSKDFTAEKRYLEELCTIDAAINRQISEIDRYLAKIKECECFKSGSDDSELALLEILEFQQSTIRMAITDVAQLQNARLQAERLAFEQRWQLSPSQDSKVSSNKYTFQAMNLFE